MASMSGSLECSVCLSTYNLSDRRPKALGCQHTICEQCVYQLTKGSSINCPTCRQQFPTSQVAVNVALTDVLQAMCGECVRLPHEMKCPHCSVNLCGKCLERHSESYREELILALKKLDSVIQLSTDFVKDGSFIEQQEEKAADTVNDIEQAIQSHRDELDRLEKRLQLEVESTTEKNLSMFAKQSETLTEKIEAVKGFPAENLKRLEKNSTTIQEMVSVQRDCKNLREELTVEIDDTCFVKAEAPFDPTSVATLDSHRVNMNMNTMAEGVDNIWWF